MSSCPHRSRPPLTLGVVALAASMLASYAPVGAAIANPPHEDLFFLTEHLPEAAQDARAFSLLWPEGSLAPGRWKLHAGIAGASADGGVATLRGALATVGASRAWSEHWGVSIFAFYDRFDVRAGKGEEVLSDGGIPALPLDLPERVEITGAGGTVRHLGGGVLVERAFGGSAGASRWNLVAGLTIDRLERDAYAFRYRLLGGTTAGVSGTVEQSGSNDFVTPLVGLQWVRPLGSRLLLLPRAVAGAPLPAGDLHIRITGPGFDRSTRDPGGRPGRIGDGFVALGAGLRDRASGFELDLGAALLYPLFERFTHDGIDRSLLLSLSWHAR